MLNDTTGVGLRATVVKEESVMHLYFSWNMESVYGGGRGALPLTLKLPSSEVGTVVVERSTIGALIKRIALRTSADTSTGPERGVVLAELSRNVEGLCPPSVGLAVLDACVA